MYPDYQNNSLVNLMSRLARVFGASNSDYALLAHGSLARLADYQHIVLLVIDGLGANYVDSHAGFLQSHKRTELTSVFPSTTASAITTFMTGLAPQQHGLVGWYTYLQEVGAITAVLPGYLRGSHELLVDRGLDIGALYGQPPIFDRFDTASTVIAPDWIINSPFNVAHSGQAHRVGYTDLHSMLLALKQCLLVDERQYIYAYWADFDRLSHQFGNHSVHVARHYQQLEQALADFNASIDSNSSLILITADHGFIDTQPDRVVQIADHPVLQQSLSQPLSGEPRVAYCYVHPHREESFVDYVQTQLADKMELHRSEALIHHGVFGIGAPHPQLAQRVGDYTLIMKDNFIIRDWVAGEKPFFQHGVHGGTSEQEMRVPLIILDNGG